MRLACGKFDPDLNPPPFSKWSNHFSAIEVDLVSLLGIKPKVQTYFQNWVKRKDLKLIPRVSIRTDHSREEYEEWIGIWEERFGEQTLFYELASGRKLWDRSLTERALSRLPKGKAMWFEWGQDDQVSSSQFLRELPNFQGYVVDPDWHRSDILKLTSMKFKLHGWSEERWVRRYGESQAKRLTNFCLKIDPTSELILAHSGRYEEASHFNIVRK